MKEGNNINNIEKLKNKIFNEDCISDNPNKGMNRIPDKSIDMILCDLPYGQTARNKWDTVIPFDKLWGQYNRIIKDNGAIVLFANGMFTADLMESNKENWKYNLVWDKVLPSGFLNAKRMPMRSHEDICVFYKKPPTYNPQMVKGESCHSKGKAVGKRQDDLSDRNTNYRDYKVVETEGDLKYPKSILTFQKPHPSTTIHPTQKSVDCLEWLINTYTNEDEIVLDNCIGSGSTMIACMNTNRKFIGFELDNTYYNLAKNRVNQHISHSNLQDTYNLIA